MAKKNSKNHGIGKELVKEQLISESQLRTAIEYENSLGGRLTEILIRLGFVDEKELHRYLVSRKPMKGPSQVIPPAPTTATASPQPTPLPAAKQSGPQRESEVLAEELVARIHDPVLAALAQTLIRSGSVKARSWLSELSKNQEAREKKGAS